MSLAPRQVPFESRSKWTIGEHVPALSNRARDGAIEKTLGIYDLAQFTPAL